MSRGRSLVPLVVNTYRYKEDYLRDYPIKESPNIYNISKDDNKDNIYTGIKKDFIEDKLSIYLEKKKAP
jgi:hypothetical protein